MNANITKIEVVETIHTMGEVTEIQARDFTAWLESQLAKEFPAADIYCRLDNRQSSTAIYAESVTDSEGYPLETEPVAVVKEFINHVWDCWR